MHSLYQHYLLASLVLLLWPTSVSAQSSCIPINCVAECLPKCSGTDVCVLSTMSNCGQCPASRCISRSALGISSPSDNSNSSHATMTNSEQQEGNNGSLIGGLVGGLVGGGLVISGLAFWIYRSRSNFLFQLATSQQQQQEQQPSSMMDNRSIMYPSLSDMSRSRLDSIRDSTCHSITSGVIPVAYIPPSHEVQQSPQFNNTTTTALENPFQDPHPFIVDIINRDSNNEDDEGSILSADHHQIHARYQAIQVTRAKPQVLHVSSLRRNGSAPTLTIRSNQQKGNLARSNTIDLVTATSNRADQHQDNDNDDDGNSELGSSRPSTSYSLGSTLGDGEITIFWHRQQQH